MKRLKQILSGVFIAALVAVSAVPAQKAEAAVPELSIASKDNKVPVYQAGKAQKWTLVVSNHIGQDMGSVVIAARTGRLPGMHGHFRRISKLPHSHQHTGQLPEGSGI